MSIADSIKEIKQSLPDHVTLVAVSKTKPNSDILEAYEAGQRDFGENKVQDLAVKAASLPEDINWHFIGHLQTNKVKYIAPFVHLIHAVDSYKLLKEINKRAANNGRLIDCLLQLSIADEESKFGFESTQLLSLLNDNLQESLPNIRIRGIMGMATNTEDKSKIMAEFNELTNVFKKASNIINQRDFDIISMGMTNDYKIAVEAGSNMVRIGSLIFGKRN